MAVEFGLKAGLAVYIITGVLALFFCPDLEAVCIFLFLLGYYPLLKPWLDRAARPVVRVLAKLAICNLSVLACYGLLLFVFPLPALQAEMGAGQHHLLGLRRGAGQSVPHLSLPHPASSVSAGTPLTGPSAPLFFFAGFGQRRGGSFYLCPFSNYQPRIFRAESRWICLWN